MKLRQLLLIPVVLYVSGAVAADSAPVQKPHKANYRDEQGFASPGSTVRQLAEDDEEKMPLMRFESFDEALLPWFEWKKSLNEDTGFQYSLAYTATAQKASDSLTGEDSGASSVFYRIEVEE